MKMHKIAALFGACALVALAGCQTPPPTSPEAVGEVRAGSGYLNGYLPRKQYPDSLALLPEPPASGSSRAAADLDAYRATRALRGTPRWEMAIADVNLKFPAAAETFSCALDLPISPEATPHLNMLLRRTLIDLALPTYAAKDAYKRQRPYAALGGSTCEPSEEKKLSTDGAYPSGHAAIGWGWALVLTELAPERTDALLARGRAFGQSRVICGYHWQSDVDAGREVAAAALARLHADPTFVAQAAQARAEIAQARAQGRRATRDCRAEAAAIAR